MARYNLTQNETDILVSWLYEPGGYLESAIDNFGLSARTALQIDSTLDVTIWIRTSIRNPTEDLDSWNETGMVWWIWKNDQVNVTPPGRPPETALWVARLRVWDASIAEAFAHRGEVQRNATDVTLYTQDGQTSTIPAGAHLTSQRNIIGKVLGVLE